MKRITASILLMFLLSSALGGVGYLFVSFIRQNSNDVVSTYEANLEKLLEVYR